MRISPYAFLGLSCVLLQPFQYHYPIPRRILPISPAPALRDEFLIRVRAIGQAYIDNRTLILVVTIGLEPRRIVGSKDSCVSDLSYAVGGHRCFCFLLCHATTLSPYSQAGERLFYQRLCVGADRPTASLLASSAPGTIYIATGPDEKEKVVWLIATVLHGNASDTVRWLRVSSGEPLVLGGELSLSGMDHRLAD